MGGKIRKVLFYVFLAAFLVSGGRFLYLKWEDKQSAEAYEKTRQELVQIVETTPPASDRTQEEPVPDEPKKEPGKVQTPPPVTEIHVDFEALHAVNEDVVAWIWIPNTPISYPVLLGEDNDEYIYTLYTGKSNRAGSIFMDFRNDGTFGDDNTVLYGHNMQNGTMFSALRNYRSADYCKAHPEIRIITPKGEIIYKIFSSYITDATGDTYDRSLGTAEEKQARLADYGSRSYVATGAAPVGNEDILTLSTCVTAGKDLSRIVVQAYRVTEELDDDITETEETVEAPLQETQTEPSAEEPEVGTEVVPEPDKPKKEGLSGFATEG